MARRPSLRRSARLFARVLGRRALLLGLCVTVPLAILQTLQIRKYNSLLRQSDANVRQIDDKQALRPDSPPSEKPQEKLDPVILAAEYEHIRLAPGRDVLLLGGRAYMVGDRTPFGRLQVIASDHSVFFSRGEIVIVKPNLQRFLNPRPAPSTRQISSENM